VLAHARGVPVHEHELTSEFKSLSTAVQDVLVRPLREWCACSARVDGFLSVEGLCAQLAVLASI
jgi:hypothetical protein